MPYPSLHQLRLTLFTILICFAGGLQVAAQQWAADGTVWTYEEQHAFSSLKRPVHFMMDGDTAINGKVFRRIVADRRGYDYFPGDTTLAYTYEENGVVHIYDFNRDTTTTLFDFNATAGNSWLVQWDTCTSLVEVQSVDSVEVNGQWIKRLTVLNKGSSQVYEGLGQDFQMFPTEWFSYSCDPLIYDGEFLAGLRCFEQPGFGSWNSGLYDKCDTVITGLDEPDRTSIDISPNPITDQFKVELPMSSQWTVELFSINGRKIKTVEFVGTNRVISGSRLRAGLYILKVTSPEGKAMTKKLVKE